MSGRIRIVWDTDLAAGAHATVTDESPPLADLDPTDTLAVVRTVYEGLGIHLSTVREAHPRDDEVAAWAVRHGKTGVLGRMTVIAS